jgi:hypothetical protein
VPQHTPDADTEISRYINGLHDIAKAGAGADMAKGVTKRYPVGGRGRARRRADTRARVIGILVLLLRHAKGVAFRDPLGVAERCS